MMYYSALFPLYKYLSRSKSTKYTPCSHFRIRLCDETTNNLPKSRDDAHCIHHILCISYSSTIPSTIRLQTPKIIRHAGPEPPRSSKQPRPLAADNSSRKFPALTDSGLPSVFHLWFSAVWPHPYIWPAMTSRARLGSQCSQADASLPATYGDDVERTPLPPGFHAAYSPREPYHHKRYISTTGISSQEVYYHRNVSRPCGQAAGEPHV